MSDCIRNARLRVLFDVFVMRDIVFIIDEYVVGGAIFIRRSVLEEIKQKTIVYFHQDVLFDWDDFLLFSDQNEMEYLCVELTRKDLIRMFKFVFSFGGGNWWAAEASRLETYKEYRINIVVINLDGFVVDAQGPWVTYMCDDTRTYIWAILKYCDASKMLYWREQADEFNKIGSDADEQAVAVRNQRDDFDVLMGESIIIHDGVQPPPFKRRRL